MIKKKLFASVVTMLVVFWGMNVMASDITDEPVQEHVYSEPVFDWAGNMMCSATVECQSCEDVHKERYDCEITTEIIYPKCTEPGQKISTATVEIDGVVYTDKYYVELEAYGHKFEDTECKRCDAVRNPESEVTIPATRKVYYSGSTYTIKVKDVQGSTGEITYQHYMNKKCTVLTTAKNSGAKRDGGAPAQPGVYYVVATIAADDNYRETVTEPSKLTICPRKIQTLKAVNVSNGIKLTWSKREEADGYIIYIKTNPNSSGAAIAVIKGKNKTSFVDTGWTNGQKYYYNIVAYGDIYGDSDTVVISNKRDKNIQAIHYNINITNQNGSVKLKWKKSNDTGVKGYYIYRKRAGESNFTKVTTIKNPKTVTWTDKSSKTVVNGKKVQYYIKAYYGKSNSIVTKSAEYTNYYLSKPKASKSGDYIKWKKVSKASGYEVNYQSSIWGDVKEKVSNNVTKMDVYDSFNSWARVRAYKKVNGKYYYSAWSEKISKYEGLKNPN